MRVLGNIGIAMSKRSIQVKAA